MKNVWTLLATGLAVIPVCWSLPAPSRAALAKFTESDLRYYEVWGLSGAEASDYFEFAKQMAWYSRYKRAANYFEKALLLDPDYLDAHAQYAEVLVQLKKPEQAFVHFEALIGTPLEAIGRANMGVILGEMRKPEEAVVHFQKACDLDPENPDNLFNLAVALDRLQRSEEAVVQFEHLAQIQPDSTRAHSHLGRLLRELERFDEALPHYEFLAQRGVRKPRNQLNLGLAYEAVGDAAKARQAYEKALVLAEKTDQHALVGEIKQRLNTRD